MLRYPSPYNLFFLFPRINDTLGIIRIRCSQIQMVGALVNEYGLDRFGQIHENAAGGPGIQAAVTAMKKNIYSVINLFLSCGELCVPLSDKNQMIIEHIYTCTCIFDY